MQVRAQQCVPALLDAWDELADRTGAAPWLRPGWTQAWWRAFGRGRLEFISVHDGGELVGICPVASLPGLRTAVANWHSPTFAPLAEGPDALEALSDALVRGRTILTLRPLPSAEVAACTLRAAAARHGCRTVEATQMRSPYLALDGTFEDFCSRRPPGRGLLKDIRRNRRGLEAEGDLAFEVHDGTRDLHALLVEAYDAEAAGWKGASGTAIASRPETYDFYTAIARWAADRGWLRLAFLRLQGRAIASEFCLMHGSTLANLKGGYRAEHRKRGPGMLITQEMVRWCYRNGLTELDMLGGDDAYKLRWTDHTRERSVMRVFPDTPAGRAAWAAYRHGRPMAERTLDVARTWRPHPRAVAAARRRP